jgi:hypothetical protein
MPKTFIVDYCSDHDNFCNNRKIMQNQSYPLFEWLLNNRSEWKVNHDRTWAGVPGWKDLLGMASDYARLCGLLNLVDAFNSKWSITRMKTEHDTLSFRYNRERVIMDLENRGIDPVKPFPISPIWPREIYFGSAVMKLMDVPLHIVQDGIAQRHCLPSYVFDLINNHCVVYAIYVDGVLYSHAMYRTSTKSDGSKVPYLRQHKAFHNASVTNEDALHLEKNFELLDVSETEYLLEFLKNDSNKVIGIPVVPRNRELPPGMEFDFNPVRERNVLPNFPHDLEDGFGDENVPF